MMRKYILFSFCTFIFVAHISTSSAQVGINTTNPASGALLDIFASDKGLLVPHIALNNTVDAAAVNPSPSVGLLVYNTITSGSLPFQVTPGFYYWSGGQWLRFYSRGYGIKFDQTTQTTANTLNVVYTQIADLDTGFINVPYSGTYQVKVETAYACGNLSTNSSEGVGQASVSLNMTTGNLGIPARVKEKYVTSTSKRIGGKTINSIPQNTTILYTVDLDLVETYRFNVTGREWSRNNVAVGTFGKDTSGYDGANSVNNAQRGSISITLLRQQ